MLLDKWNKRFLCLAAHISTWSKDPSTKVGCVIVDPEKKVIGLGYNGFPSYLDDDPFLLQNREEKYKRTIHAEINAILNSSQSVKNCYMFCTHQPCVECAKFIIQSGIIEVQWVYNSTKGDINVSDTKQLFKEAGIFYAQKSISP